MKHSSKTLLTIALYLLPAMVFISFFITTISSGAIRFRVLGASDIYWLLKTGEYICSNGIPATDVFSYTHAGKEWILYQWLFEVLIFKIYSFGEAQALGSFTVFIFALMLIVIYFILRNYKVNTFYCVLAMALGGWIASAVWYARPGMFTYLFMCLLLLLFRLGENKNVKFLWFIPVVFLVWANMHIGFTFGILLFVMFLTYKLFAAFFFNDYKNLPLVTKLIQVAILSFLATLITPYGIKLYFYLYDLVLSTSMNNTISELLSPDFHKKQYSPILFALVLIIPLSVFQKKQDLFYLLCLALTTYMTLLFVRHVPLFAIFATLVIAIQLQRLQEYVVNNDDLRKSIKVPFETIVKAQDYCRNLIEHDTKYIKIYLPLVVISLFTLALISIQNVDTFKQNYKFSQDNPLRRPFMAINFISKHDIPGNLYAPPAWGSYMINKLHPKYKVFIDTRFDMYGDEFFREAYEIQKKGDMWQKILKKYRVNWIVVPSTSYISLKIDSGVADNWFIIYKGLLANIYMRKTPENLKWYKETGIEAVNESQD